MQRKIIIYRIWSKERNEIIRKIVNFYHNFLSDKEEEGEEEVDMMRGIDSKSINPPFLVKHVRTRSIKAEKKAVSE